MRSGIYQEGITLKKEWEMYSRETQKKEVKIQKKTLTPRTESLTKFI